MKEDVLQERVDDIQEIVAEAKFGDELSAEQLHVCEVKC